VAKRRQQVTFGGLVGVGGLLGNAYSYIGTSIYFVLGGIALYALGVTPILILVVGLVFILTAWSYAEASAAMPEASGVASFARRAFDPLTGFAAAWALLLDSIILVAIACKFVPSYLGAVWPQLEGRPYDLLVSVGVLVLLVALNLLGLHESPRLGALMAVLGLVTLVLLILLGLFVLFRPGVAWSQIDLGSAPTWGRLLFAVPLAAAAFTGLDAVSSRAESALRPGRDVPLTINLVLPLIVILSVALAVVGLSAMPTAANVVPVDTATGLTVPVPVVPGDKTGVYVYESDPSVTVVVPVAAQGEGHVIPAQKPEGDVFAVPGGQGTRLHGTLLGSAYLEDPLMGIVAALPGDLQWLQRLLRPWVAIVIAVALLLAANGVIGGSSRVLYSLARHRQAPPVLGRVLAARMEPFVGVVLFACAAAVLLVPEDPLILLGLFGFGAMLAFTATHLSVIKLRYREPALSRPFVVPFSVRSGGASLPLPAVIGAVATATIWVAMVATHPAGRILGFAWMAAGLLMYVIYRRSAGQALLRQPREALLPAAARSDVDYERILVPVLGTRLSDEMMVLGCQLAADKGAVIDVVYVVEVPMNLPLDAPMPTERQRGKRVLDAALLVAQEFGVEAWPHLVLSRHRGRAIVDTATEWNCDVVIMGAVRKLRTDDLLGSAVTYVLRHAPGEVLLNYVPEDYPMQGSGSEPDIEDEDTGRPDVPAATAAKA
jgi:APA family basic amino acid/polyamine antiporter